jgi:hypothetical protein
LPLEAAILAGTLNAMANQESLTEALITTGVGKRNSSNPTHAERSDQFVRTEDATEFSFDKVIFKLPVEAKVSVSKALNSETGRFIYRSSESLILAATGTSSEQRTEFLLQNFPNLLPHEAHVLGRTLLLVGNQDDLAKALSRAGLGKRKT